ncbi:MAG: hypothetical protein SGARI_007869 [Bacillariaceae sp.]
MASNDHIAMAQQSKIRGIDNAIDILNGELTGRANSEFYDCRTRMEMLNILLAFRRGKGYCLHIYTPNLPSDVQKGLSLLLGITPVLRKDAIDVHMEWIYYCEEDAAE